MRLFRVCVVFVVGVAVFYVSGCTNIKKSKEDISNLIDNYVKYSAVFFNILSDSQKRKIIENGDTSNLSKDELSAANKYLKLFAEQRSYESITVKMIWFGSIVGYDIKKIAIYGDRAVVVIHARAKSALSISDTPDEYNFIFTLKRIKSQWRIQNIELVNPNPSKNKKR